MATQLENLKARIPYEEVQHLDIDEDEWEEMLEDLLEDSMNIAFARLYPYEDYPETLPTRYNNWQLRACVELFNLADKAGITNYSENGISWSKISDGLSNSLLEELTSRVGIPRKTETTTEEGDTDEVQS